MDMAQSLAILKEMIEKTISVDIHGNINLLEIVKKYDLWKGKGYSYTRYWPFPKCR